MHSLTPRQTELLTAIGRGEVADRYHYRCGWATRWYLLNGRRITASSRGGGMGRNVTASVETLVKRGLATRTDGPTPYADHPYALTDEGRRAALR